MQEQRRGQELYHDIFGSVLDRDAMTPYLLKDSHNYEKSIRQATCMMANRGFGVDGDGLAAGERERALAFVFQARDYFKHSLFPFVRRQLRNLAGLNSPRAQLYAKCLSELDEIEGIIFNPEFSSLVAEDPRHLFLMSSSAKYADLFSGYRGQGLAVPREWQKAACAILKMCHLVKSIEEDSQDIADYAQLGFFLQRNAVSLVGLFSFNWDDENLVPEEESARRAYVKLAAFFKKLGSSTSYNKARGTYVFDSGDGVRVEIAGVMARLKSPESMFAKLGKSVEGEAYDIRDILAITFLLNNRDDTLTLFHALQKQGLILQENTASASITQTIFTCPDDMQEAVHRLMLNLARSEGRQEAPSPTELREQTAGFFEALSVNGKGNPHSSAGHQKFQCKISYSVPIQYDAKTREVLLPGADPVSGSFVTRQGTLPVEIRISDRQTWDSSETKGEAHHDAYKLRQLLPLCNRLFAPLFLFPRDAEPGLRADQALLFP
jgi:uncharacterized protein (TIGR04552 family)